MFGSYDAIETLEHCGKTIRIYADEDAESSREWDNLGTMVCFHGRYNLGDDHNYDSPQEFLEDIGENAVILPLYLYDHSGITISTGPFSCPWDSGQIGWVYVTYEKIRKEYGWTRITKARRKQIEGYLRGEVETYDLYLTGQVYGYVIFSSRDSDAEEFDSCWGFYGMDHCIEESKQAAEYQEKAELPLLDHAKLITS